MKPIFSKLLPAVLVAGLTVAGATAQTKTDRLVVVGFGGTYQEAQRKAFFEPFAKASGVTVREDTGAELSRLRAEVESRNPAADITATNMTTYLIGLDQGLWASIDYKYFDPKDLAAMPDEVKKANGVGTIYYTDGLGFNTKAFPAGGPQPNSWTDFWDVQRFPGKRALPQCDVASNPLPEIAQLAMGVPQDKIYDNIDMDKVIAKLKELGDNLIWWSNQGQPGQMLASREAVMALAPTGRLQILTDAGAPVEAVWNGARYTYDLWFVLKSARNADSAMRFIAYASRPEAQAEMARLAHYAPTNPRAYDLLDKATAEKLATYPANFKQTFAKSEEWWKANREKWIEKCTAAFL